MKKKNKIMYILLLLVSIVSISSISHAANVSSDEYKITSKENTNYIIGIYPNTRVEKVKANIKANSNINIYNEKGQAVGENEIVVTGNKIQIENETYIAIVCGDVNADGNANLTDLVKIKSHLIGKEILEKEKGIAADVDANGRVTSTDILNLKRLLVRIIEEREIFEKKYSNSEYEYKKNTLTNKIAITELIDTKASGTLQIPSKIDGNEVKEIENFLGENSKITKVTIPTGIEKISNIAFSGLTNLQGIEVSGLNENYCSEEGILYNKGKDTLVCYPRGKEEKEYTIGEEVKKIGEFAFYKNSKIEKLYLTDEIEEVEKNAFEEMKGKVYVKEGSDLIAMLREKGINYAIDAKPEITKLTSTEGTNQVITLTIEATDDVGIVAWSVEAKGTEKINWKKIEATKNFQTKYQEIPTNGTYVVRVKDTVGNIGEKEIVIKEIDETTKKVKEIRIISPTSGEYEPGQKIIIRVSFTGNVVGEAPQLKVTVGNEIGTGTMTNTEARGTTDYIDYTYITNDQQMGEIGVYSYTGGSLKGTNGKPVSIFKLASVGNNVSIKLTLEELQGTTRIPNGQMSDAELAEINQHLENYINTAYKIAKAKGDINPKRAKVMAAAYWLIYNPFYRVQYQWGRPLAHDDYYGIGWDPSWSNTRGIECQNFVLWSLWNAGAKSIYPNASQLQHSEEYLDNGDHDFTVQQVLNAGIEPGDILRKSRTATENGHWSIVMTVNREEGYIEVAHAVDPSSDTKITRYNVGGRFRYQHLYKLPDFYN